MGWGWQDRRGGCGAVGRGEGEESGEGEASKESCSRLSRPPLPAPAEAGSSLQPLLPASSGCQSLSLLRVHCMTGGAPL